MLLDKNWKSFFEALEAYQQDLSKFTGRPKLPKYTFSGRRVKRGLYQASNGRYINADINGAANIIRKVAPDAFGSEGVEDGKGVFASLVVHPVRITLAKPRKASGH